MGAGSSYKMVVDIRASGQDKKDRSAAKGAHNKPTLVRVYDNIELDINYL